MEPDNLPEDFLGLTRACLHFKGNRTSEGLKLGEGWYFWFKNIIKMIIYSCKILKQSSRLV